MYKGVHLLYYKARKLNKQINKNTKAIEDCSVQETLNPALTNPPSWAGSSEGSQLK